VSTFVNCGDEHQPLCTDHVALTCGHNFEMLIENLKFDGKGMDQWFRNASEK